MNLNFINDLEDARLYKKLLARLHESYPPVTVQHEADLNNLARLNWQSERLANLIETDLNQRLQSPLVRNIKDPNRRLLRATRRALARREHIILIKQNEANLRATNTLVTRIEKWHASR
ncbi:MAG: hypothetical protein FJW36_08225 [Acidobacteria bacterium]|nr:hypothetical protein [Acidobacteriota bacterium]